MVKEFGDNLHVLIVANVNDNWESFATWYSINKNLPYANCSLFYPIKKNQTPFQMFQWAKRLNISTLGFLDRKDAVKNILTTISQIKNNNILIVPSLCMVLKPLTNDLLNSINNKEEIFNWDKEEIGFSNLSQKAIFKSYHEYEDNDNFKSWNNKKITIEAKEEESLYSLVSYKKGCGKWIHTKKGCPFSSAGGLVSDTMTINEQKIIDLWRKMVPLYNAIQ